jgi:hypothetical protein
MRFTHDGMDEKGMDVPLVDATAVPETIDDPQVEATPAPFEISFCPDNPALGVEPT